MGLSWKNIKNAGKKIKNKVVDIAEDAYDFVKDKVVDPTVDWVENAYDKTKEAVKSAIDYVVPDWMQDAIRWTGNLGANIFEWVNYTNPLFLVGKLTGQDWLMNIATGGTYWLNEQYRALNNYLWGTDDDEEGNPTQKLNISDFTNTAIVYSLLDVDINDYIEKHVCQWLSLEDFLVFYYGFRNADGCGVLDYLENYYGYAANSMSGTFDTTTQTVTSILHNNETTDISEGIKDMFYKKEGFLPFNSKGLIRGVYKTTINEKDLDTYREVKVYKTDNPKELSLFVFDNDEGFILTEDEERKGNTKYYQREDNIYYYVDNSELSSVTELPSIEQDDVLYTKDSNGIANKSQAFIKTSYSINETPDDTTYYRRIVKCNGNEKISYNIKEYVDVEDKSATFFENLTINRCIVRRCRFLNNEFGFYTDEYKKLVMHLWRVYDYDIVSATNVNPICFFVRNFATMQELFYKYGWREDAYTVSANGGISASNHIPTERYRWKGVVNGGGVGRFRHSTESFGLNYYYYALKAKAKMETLKDKNGNYRYNFSATYKSTGLTHEEYFCNRTDVPNTFCYNTQTSDTSEYGAEAGFEQEFYKWMGKFINNDLKLNNFTISRYYFLTRDNISSLLGINYDDVDELSANAFFNTLTSDNKATLLKYKYMPCVGQGRYGSTAFDFYAQKFKIPVSGGAYEDNWLVYPQAYENSEWVYAQSYNFDLLRLLGNGYTAADSVSNSIFYKNGTTPLLHSTSWHVAYNNTHYYPSLTSANYQIMGMTYENHKFFTLSEVRLMVSQILVKVMSYYKYKGYNVTPLDSLEHLQQFRNSDQPIEKNVPLSAKTKGYYEVSPYTYIVGFQVNWAKQEDTTNTTEN